MVGSARCVDPANERLDAREQFGEGEGLREIIVAPGPQAAHAIVHGSFRAQDDDRHFHPLRPPLLDHAEAIETGEHQIDNGGVVVIVQSEVQAVIPTLRSVHGEARLLQPFADEFGDFSVIFDEEDAHGCGA